MKNLLYILLVSALAGCSRQDQAREAKAEDSHTALLMPSIPSEGTPEAQLLRETFPGASILRHDMLKEELQECLEQGRVVVAGFASEIPVHCWDPLTAFRNQGGSVVLWGASPFAEQMVLHDGRLRSGRQYEIHLAGDARELDAAYGIQGWSHRSELGLSKGSVNKSSDALAPWGAVDVELGDFADWDYLISPMLEYAEFQPNENALAFYARGDALTGHLVIRAETEDGSFYTVVPLEADWQVYVVHADDFTPADTQPNRTLNLPDIRHLSAGLDNRLLVQRPGKHHYGISNFRTVADVRPHRFRSGGPDDWLVGPEAKLYSFPSSEIEGRFSRGSYNLRGTPVQSLPPVPRLTVLEDGTTRRFIPLYKSAGSDRKFQGYPVCVIQELENDRASRAWAWIGIPYQPATRHPLRNILQEAAEYLHQGWYIRELEPIPPCMEPGASIELDVGYLPGRNAEAKRIAAELIDFRGKIIRRAVSSALSNINPGKVRLKLGKVPAITRSDTDLQLRILLENIGGQNEIFDELDYRFKVLHKDISAVHEYWLTATGPSLTENKRPRFFLGVNYNPSPAWPDEENPGSWLMPYRFQHDQVKQHLDLLYGHGFNAVSIALEDRSELPGLRYFLDEVRSRRFRIYVVLSALNPLDPDLELAEALLEGMDASQRNEIAAIELGYHGVLENMVDPSVLQAAWETWLIEQFGSADHALEKLKPFLEQAGGRPLLLPPDLLQGNGEHNTAAAVYRRFIEDLVSRRTGYLVRWLRSKGYRQLISLRKGNLVRGHAETAGRVPLSFAAAAEHLDLTGLPGWAFRDAHDPVNRLLFLTALARGESGAKPVIWRDLGFPLFDARLPSQERELERIFQLFFYAAVKGKAAGLFAGHFPEPGSDPLPFWGHDGQLRIPFRPFRGFANTTRSIRGNPKAWSGLTVDRFASASGEDGLWAEGWNERYPEPTEQGSIEELRPVLFGTQSTDLEPVLPGGGAFSSPAPIRGLNAEWGATHVAGEPVLRKPGEALPAATRAELDLELLNTGSVRWIPGRRDDPGAVLLLVKGPRGQQTQLRIERTSPNERFMISWRPPSEGTWTLRPYLGGIGGFGEKLVVAVE